MRTSVLELREVLGLAEIFDQCHNLGYIQFKLEHRVAKRIITVLARQSVMAPWVEVGHIHTHEDVVFE